MNSRSSCFLAKKIKKCYTISPPWTSSLARIAFNTPAIFFLEFLILGMTFTPSWLETLRDGSPSIFSSWLMRTIRRREIFTKKCWQQQNFDSYPKEAWHYNHVTFTPIAKNVMLYCRLIYMLSILCVRLTIKVKVGIPESFKVGWYPPKKLGRVTLTNWYAGRLVEY